MKVRQMLYTLFADLLIQTNDPVVEEEDRHRHCEVFDSVPVRVNFYTEGVRGWSEPNAY